MMETRLDEDEGCCARERLNAFVLELLNGHGCFFAYGIKAAPVLLEESYWFKLHPCTQLYAYKYLKAGSIRIYRRCKRIRGKALQRLTSKPSKLLLLLHHTSLIDTNLLCHAYIDMA